MFNLDPGKLLVIAVVAIILLGPDRLPQVARQVGGAWRSFNEFRHRMESEVRNTMPDLPPTSEIARLARSPSALLNHLSNMSSDDEEPDGSFQPPTLTDARTERLAAATPASPSRLPLQRSPDRRGARSRSTARRRAPPTPTPSPAPPPTPTPTPNVRLGPPSRPAWSFPATRP